VDGTTERPAVLSIILLLGGLQHTGC